MSRWIQSSHVIPYEQRRFDFLVRGKDLKMQVEEGKCGTADFKMKGRSHELSHAQSFKNQQGKWRDFFPSPTHILSLNSGDLHKTCNLHKSKTIHWWCLVFGQIGNVFQQQQKFNEKLYFNCHLSAITVSLDSLAYS